MTKNETLCISIENARNAFERIANEEAQSLASDATYAAWLRSKKLAEIEVTKLQEELRELEAAQAAAAQKRERDAIQAQRDACAARGKTLEGRLEHLRDVVWPQLRDLLIALAEHEIERDRINRIVSPGQAVVSPEVAVRCKPSQPSEIREEEIVDLWTVPGTLVPAAAQDSIAPNGRFKSGVSSAVFSKLPYRRIVKYKFEPARDYPPLYSSIVMPSLDRQEASQFNGPSIHSPQAAIDALTKSRTEYPREVEVSHKPLAAAPDFNNSDLLPPPLQSSFG